MRFALMIEPQMGLTYEEQLAVARHAEAAGFEAFFRSDHYESFPGDAGNPTTDAWAVLAGLARDTKRIGLGALVSPVTYRLPGQPRQGRADGRRDERRPGRARDGRRLARRRAPPPRVPVPRDRRARGHAGGGARDRPRPVGGARRLVVHRDAIGRSRTRCSGRSPDRCRDGTVGGRTSSPAATAALAATGSRRAGPTSSTCRPPAPTARRRSSRPSTRPCMPSVATRRR